MSDSDPITRLNDALEGRYRVEGELGEGGMASVVVVKDATAAAVTPELGDGYASALTNYGFMANDVITTDQAVQAMTAAS